MYGPFLVARTVKYSPSNSLPTLSPFPRNHHTAPRCCSGSQERCAPPAVKRTYQVIQCLPSAAVQRHTPLLQRYSRFSIMIFLPRRHGCWFCNPMTVSCRHQSVPVQSLHLTGIQMAKSCQHIVQGDSGQVSLISWLFHSSRWHELIRCTSPYLSSGGPRFYGRQDGDIPFRFFRFIHAPNGVGHASSKP